MALIDFLHPTKNPPKKAAPMPKPNGIGKDPYTANTPLDNLLQTGSPRSPKKMVLNKKVM